MKIKYIFAALFLFGIGGWLFWLQWENKSANISETANEKAVPVRADASDPPRMTLDPFISLNSIAASIDDPREKLAFSNTMEWDVVIRASLAQKPFFNVSLDSFDIPSPPANSSARTVQELQLLHEYQDTFRTKEILKAIGAEASTLENIQFGDYTYGEYINAKKFPKTSALLRNGLKDIEITVLKLKEHFDRVRPTELDPTLAAVIAVPGHPAYPGGHSTQVYFIAYTLSELIPEKRAVMETSALRVALHREIAGLHYSSDTAAGALLARQFVDALKKNQKFKEMFEEAKAEWSK